MALKSKQPSAGATERGKTVSGSAVSRSTGTAVPATQQGSAAPTETTEDRLERKAAVADMPTFAATSLGEMTREQRHRLLYGD